MEIIKNNRGGQKLCINGFTYTKQFTRKTYIRWECSHRRLFNCNGSVTTDLAVGDIINTIEHSHDQDEKS